MKFDVVCRFVAVPKTEVIFAYLGGGLIVREKESIWLGNGGGQLVWGLWCVVG